ncbi:methylated-DNA--[protein]-cysteine S-methyltransferase [Clostridia bacterium]|nr:methylated-DNA--[protein]-cysteine S-methyltransferase [Clostridia bacterium]
MLENVGYMQVESPMGPLLIGCKNAAIVSLQFDAVEIKTDHIKQSPVAQEAICQLKEYFAGKRKSFDLPLTLEGTIFQHQVWEALQKIPYGEVKSYKQIAEIIGRPRAYRAVGGANNRNPIPIIIPCHRVIGADASMVGYRDGVEKKAWLLRHEKVFSL